ncbi:GDP-D-glucose phosphorylase 1 [Melipona quadrifasciata]|uniref:GDP-D-glucose phosphorylase 1 n=1 Tax=Melipona quadrifasciata TaxID=166423 RepID=A0A0M9A7Y0_9HYME|nr:GDP-D-glucose phosphorylase 1 [Melipona quadrifasciata]
MAFNSLCAYASVNHLHWHLYYLNWKMLLEYIDLEEYAGPVQILEKYPAKGFCIKYSNVQNMDDFINWAFLIINYLQNTEIAHNVYITRGKLSIVEEYKDVRIYIWARKSTTGVKNIDAFNPAAPELFGHLSMKCNAYSIKFLFINSIKRHPYLGGGAFTEAYSDMGDVAMNVLKAPTHVETCDDACIDS